MCKFRPNPLKPDSYTKVACWKSQAGNLAALSTLDSIRQATHEKHVAHVLGELFSLLKGDSAIISIRAATRDKEEEIQTSPSDDSVHKPTSLHDVLQSSPW